ncbi:MAG: VWA domain-containing protein [Acidobacteriota bacterium]|nr:VWA domain-containing protein [Acidobacteriota bacterium]
MRTRTNWLMQLVGAMLLALPSTAWTQATQQQLFVTVVDATTGQGVHDLGAEHFVVQEDGVQRQILGASLATEPLEIAILVDTSEAARSIMREVQEGVSAFVEGLRFNIGLGVGDQVALMTFGGARFILVDWTSDLEQLKEGATKLRSRQGTGTFLPDAVNDTAKDFSGREAARPVLVVVSADGIDYSSHRDFRRIIQELRGSYTLMYSVFIPTASRRMTLNWDSRERDAVLTEGPRQTGGRRINLSGRQAITGALMSIQNELTSQYVVTYHRPESPVPPERLSLGVTRPNLTVRLTPRKPR